MNLISRLQQATCADRELDVAILTTVLGYRDIFGDGSLFDRGNDGYWSLEGDEKNPPLPSPTGSVDAALTLVPEGWVVERLSIWPHESSVSLYGTHEGKDGLRWHNFDDGRVDSVTAPTPALALCIASLIAHEKGNGSGR
jgi:hypothetical protein